MNRRGFLLGILAVGTAGLVPMNVIAQEGRRGQPNPCGPGEGRGPRGGDGGRRGEGGGRRGDGGGRRGEGGGRGPREGGRGPREGGRGPREGGRGPREGGPRRGAPPCP
ncbi:MAG TPA: hypothetical protein VM819_10920 [Vicinamibacterales bacterium]|nr:hypothetical protein [Vicinamibacterales bacterium]